MTEDRPSRPSRNPTPRPSAWSRSCSRTSRAAPGSGRNTPSRCGTPSRVTTPCSGTPSKRRGTRLQDRRRRLPRRLPPTRPRTRRRTRRPARPPRRAVGAARRPIPPRPPRPARRRRPSAATATTSAPPSAAPPVCSAPPTAGRRCLRGHGGAAGAAGCPTGASLRSLGRHRLKDLTQPQEIFQLLPPRPARETSPRLRSLESFQHNLPGQLTSFIGQRARDGRGAAPAGRDPAADADGHGRRGQVPAGLAGGRRRPGRVTRTASGWSNWPRCPTPPWSRRPSPRVLGLREEPDQRLAGDADRRPAAQVAAAGAGQLRAPGGRLRPAGRARCCAPAPICGSWPPAARRWTSPASAPCRSPPCALSAGRRPARPRPRCWRHPRPCACSWTGRPRPGPASA